MPAAVKVNSVTIVGVGLMGGSIGLGLRKLEPAPEVTGVCRREESLSRALATGAIDRGTLHLVQAVSEADLVIIASPVGSIGELARRAIPAMKANAVLTDVGSTKVEVVESIEEALLDRVHYVGGHPLAGSEKQGVAQARDDLYQDCTVVLTPTPRTSARALGVVGGMWQALGARVRELSPEQHDQLLAEVSHLPHLVAAELMNLVGDQALDFAAGGFRDLTRIAASGPDLWMEIYLSNAENLATLLRQFTKNLEALAGLLELKDIEHLRQRLAQAQDKRQKLG